MLLFERGIKGVSVDKGTTRTELYLNVPPFDGAL